MKFVTINNARNVSGCEENQLDLARWFRKERGCDTVFFVRDESVLADRAKADGFKVRKVFCGGVGKLLSPWYLAKALFQEKPDIVSINREHNIYPVYGALQLLKPFMRSPKVVAVFHSPTGRRYPVLKKFDGIICTSEYTGSSFFKNNKGLQARTEIIPYGTQLFPVEAEEKENRQRQRRIFRDKEFPLLGMVGDLWKNQAELIEVAERVRLEFPTLCVMIVGAGSPESVAALQQKINKKGLQSNVIICGRVERSKISDLFFDFDLSLSTYRHEGFGIVHIESLAAMTPLVAYNSGGIREVLKYGGGVLVDGGVDEFVAAVQELLQNDERRIAMGRSGRKIVEQYFTLDNMCQAHFDYYVQVKAGGTKKLEANT